MSLTNAIPDRPTVYHITHFSNLKSIINSGFIWSDAGCLKHKINCEGIGNNAIKQRRLTSHVVACYPHTKVGEYVPFYLCPKSIMLYKHFKGGDPEVPNVGGQEQIIHLVADMNETVTWANSNKVLWAFTDASAATYYANYYNNLTQLDKVNWKAVRATDFSKASGNWEGKQAEFLVYSAMPWQLIKCIAVFNETVENKVNQIIDTTAHKPTVKIIRNWYF